MRKPRQKPPRYWKQDEWDDGLEKAIAFGLIASHRLEELDPPVNFGGESLPYVIRLNALLGVKGRMGAAFRRCSQRFDLHQTVLGCRVLVGPKIWHRFFANCT